MTKSVKPLLDRIVSPADLRALSESDLARVAEELRAETISAVSVTGGHLGAGLGVIELTVALHYVFDTPARPDRLGRRPSGLSAQDLDRAARPHPHVAPGRRAFRLHQARGERIRRLRRRPFLDLDLRRASAWRWRAISRRRDKQCRRGDRRRRDVGGHGLRGDEQRRRHGVAADRHPQRQRHVDRAADGRDVGLSGPPRHQPHLPVAARRRQAARAPSAEVPLRQGRAHRGIRPRLLDRRHAVRGARLLLCRPDRRP